MIAEEDTDAECAEKRSIDVVEKENTIQSEQMKWRVVQSWHEEQREWQVSEKKNFS